MEKRSSLSILSSSTLVDLSRFAHLKRAIPFQLEFVLDNPAVVC